MKTWNKGFTLIELVVVLTVISILLSLGLTSYASFNKQARDARRSADLEQVRGALELYRSNIGAYPTPAGSFGMDFGSGALSDGTNTYMSLIPQDPKSPQSYYYSVSGDEYTIAALKEGESTCGVASIDCSTTAGTQACNYCLGPYGDK